MESRNVSGILYRCSFGIEIPRKPKACQFTGQTVYSYQLVAESLVERISRRLPHNARKSITVVYALAPRYLISEGRMSPAKILAESPRLY
jgi:hypothetical protein